VGRGDRALRDRSGELRRVAQDARQTAGARLLMRWRSATSTPVGHISTRRGRQPRCRRISREGDRLVSARVQEDAAGKLDLAFRDLGEQQLKNIARPVRVFAVGSAVQRPKRALPRRGIVAFIVAGAVAAAAIAAAGWWAWSWPPAATALSRSSGPPPVASEAKSAPRLSIVVLPFSNLSGDPEQGYFADGITEDLTTDLSRVQNLFVIARNTAFTYKDKTVDVKQIGRELGVRYVLEGSVRRSEDQVRVNAQLVDAETSAHLWAERFDREFGDLFALENGLPPGSRIPSAGS
jgi:adenylate cyclase